MRRNEEPETALTATQAVKALRRVFHSAEAEDRRLSEEINVLRERRNAVWKAYQEGGFGKLQRLGVIDEALASTAFDAAETVAVLKIDPEEWET